MYHCNLDTSVDIATEIEQSEQGTVSIETAFCNHYNVN